MKTQSQGYPVVKLYRSGQPVMEALVFGLSKDGGQALLGVLVPMTERHLNGGLVRSQVALMDERGQAKRVGTYRMFAYCGLHQTAWEGDGGCPECSTDKRY